MSDLENALSLLDGVKQLNTQLCAQASKAANRVGLTLVNQERLAALEAVASAAREAMKNSRMTREYKDVLEGYPDEEKYNGKRVLLRREDGGAIVNALGRLSKAPKGT